MKTSSTFGALRKEFVGQRYSFDARTIVAIILHRMESYAAQCEKQGKTRTFSRFRVSRANMRRLLRKYRITDADIDAIRDEFAEVGFAFGEISDEEFYVIQFSKMRNWIQPGLVIGEHETAKVFQALKKASDEEKQAFADRVLEKYEDEYLANTDTDEDGE